MKEKATIRKTSSGRYMLYKRDQGLASGGSVSSICATDSRCGDQSAMLRCTLFPPQWLPSDLILLLEAAGPTLGNSESASGSSEHDPLLSIAILRLCSAHS